MSIAQIAAENEVKIQNLLDAFQKERSAQARYAAFAAKADCDRLRGVASLFRAVARAKQIHADNHAHVICQLGGAAAAQVDTPDVGTTLENLRAALADESYACDSMYPAFLADSDTQNDSAAQTLNWALRADISHEHLFNEAIARIEAGESNSWVGTSRSFYVRRACGYTSETPQPDRCWMCDQMCGTFEIVG